MDETQLAQVVKALLHCLRHMFTHQQLGIQHHTEIADDGCWLDH